ncbi:hypothetical protein GUITHDRAFT_116838 [Guillardia theta CCMP2712]|uniref:Uncharacterized protein n=1 Tax=Guillardia theta (strain CCMP2712) TaxID=905079 RepID=L1ILH4_GUITC|nr:hypothetical protein GUITHDRAFT_116838 [Guillardia theta CCMP2712]EKX36972.1 hypothetical protein GUITHDRAFT_116838 [Guillardia theta CCMP2712]|eukprot:XP_005823952.1 hypothetical protein GUITHDRAFT_116838 [Guillardia theta CCMP2712]
MVRPSASLENKRIALAFAHMVTSPAPASGPARQAVCRTGRYSLYDALSACCPSSVINQDPYVGKYGLRAIEFCKVVESDGFVKVRHQRPRAKGEASSPSGLSDAGAEEVRYVYAGRRWRDPRDKEDMRALREAWEELAGSSTIFAGQCALERVVRVGMEVQKEQSWAGGFMVEKTMGRLSDMKRKTSDSPANGWMNGQKMRLGESVMNALRKKFCIEEIFDLGINEEDIIGIVA